MLTAVIFDMDGILIDSEPVIRFAAQRAGAELGTILTDRFYADLLGLPGAEVEAALLAEFGPEFPLADFRRRFEAHYREQVAARGVATKPGVPALLEALNARSVPVAVATSTHAVHAEAALRAGGILHLLPVCVTGDQVSAGKPAPEIYLRAAAHLAVEPARCIAVEDSEVGARAALAAGMFTLLVPDLKPPSAELQSLVAEVLPSMPAAASRILRLLAPAGSDSRR